jgi:hypothetical protein
MGQKKVTGKTRDYPLTVKMLKKAIRGVKHDLIALKLREKTQVTRAPIPPAAV